MALTSSSSSTSIHVCWLLGCSSGGICSRAGAAALPAPEPCECEEDVAAATLDGAAAASDSPLALPWPALRIVTDFSGLVHGLVCEIEQHVHTADNNTHQTAIQGLKHACADAKQQKQHKRKMQRLLLTASAISTTHLLFGREGKAFSQEIKVHHRQQQEQNH